MAAPSENLPDDQQPPRADARARPVPPLESANVLLWFTKQLVGSATCSTSAWRSANYMTVPVNMWPPLGSVLVPPPWESTIALNIRCRMMPTTRIANLQSRSRCCLNTAIYCTSISRKQGRFSRWDRLSIAGTNTWEQVFLFDLFAHEFFKKKKIDLFTPSPFFFLVFTHSFHQQTHARTSFTHLTWQIANKTWTSFFLSLPYFVHDKPFFFSSV